MEAAMTVNWLELRRISNAQARGRALSRTQTDESARLVEENARLGKQCRDLTASNEIWIRLYEAALARANNGAPGLPIQPQMCADLEGGQL